MQGQVENNNKWVETYIHMFCNHQQLVTITSHHQVHIQQPLPPIHQHVTIQGKCGMQHVPYGRRTHLRLGHSSPVGYAQEATGMVPGMDCEGTAEAGNPVQ
jgi:hypothetical protein